MAKYAIEIREGNRDLITVLNQGTPVYVNPNKKPSYFVFESAWPHSFQNQVVTEEELLEHFETIDSQMIWTVE